MELFNDERKLTGFCDICGDHMGYVGSKKTDHSECSKLRQEEHEGERRRKAPKKLDKKSVDWLSNFDK